ncbi:unnamed protein product, partial [Chrysoparadoxa australica]
MGNRGAKAQVIPAETGTAAAADVDADSNKRARGSDGEGGDEESHKINHIPMLNLTSLTKHNNSYKEAAPKK